MSELQSPEVSDLIFASKVRHTPVFSQDGERIGHVEDLALEKIAGRVAYAILSFGGFLGMGEKYHPLPWSVLNYDTRLGGYVVPLDKDQLKNAPSYELAELGDLGESERYREAIFAYYGPFGAMPYWMNPGRARRVLAGALIGAAIGLSASTAAAPARERAPLIQPEGTGAGLAAIGGCQGCHTSANGAPFAGGRAFATPFGAIYSTNITPDKDRGIGGWTAADFQRAMTQGIGPHGQRYYPVFPYPHFAFASRADIAAIYDYLRTVPPAPAQQPTNRMVPPFGLRSMLIGWQALYLRSVAPNTEGLDAQARRGAELVAGLGHCGACHTPHNALGAEDAAHPLAGAMAEGWYAPPLQGDSPAPSPWTADELETYLRTGISDRHQAAAGPMGAVARELAQAPEPEVRAMAIYLSGLMRPSKPRDPVDQASAAARIWPEGARVYASACANCHEPGAGMVRFERPSLALGTPLDEDRPTDVIMILLNGLDPTPEKAGPFMPSFADNLTDAQLLQLTGYLRARFSRDPAWRDLDGAVRAARKAAA